MTEPARNGPDDRRAGAREDEARFPRVTERPNTPRVVVVTALCSLRMAGEAALPYHYFRLLRGRGIDVHLVAQSRNREELEAAFVADRDRLHFVPDGFVQKVLCQLGRWLPNRVDRATFGFLALMQVQAKQRDLIRKLVRERSIDVVHQPYPVSPAEPSLIHGVGPPVVIGPMNGGMDYPPGFRGRESWAEHVVVVAGRCLRHLINRLLPGKLHAKILLVANRRTRQLLPADRRGEVIEMLENGVDLALWGDPSERTVEPGRPVCFAYVGRLVDWKGVDLLLHAWEVAHRSLSARLLLIGDGPMRDQLLELRDQLGLADSVEFAGFLPAEECARRLRHADVLVLPSLIECGGAVVLEALASGLPVIATDWGGPADYLDATCGILVPPTSREAFISGLAGAIERLGRSAELRREMGRAAVRRAALFDWDAKIDQILEVYRRATRTDATADEADEPGPDLSNPGQYLPHALGKG